MSETIIYGDNPRGEATGGGVTGDSGTGGGESDHGLERLVFFSDAVIAIAMTLLALELPLPEGETDAALWRSLRDLLPHEYFTFLLSFVVIAAYWAGHHRFFGRVTRFAPGMVWLNMGFLFAIVVLPLVTRMLREEKESQVGVVCYAVVVAAAGICLSLLQWQVSRRGLLRPDTSSAMPARMTRRAMLPAGAIMLPVGAFLISIPVAFVNTSAAEYLWLLPVPVALVFRLYRLWHRPSGAPA